MPDDLDDLMKKACTASEKWYTIGLQLGLSKYKLDKFRLLYSGRQYSHQEYCLREVLKLWLNGQNRTVGQLIKALKAVGEEKLAEVIKEYTLSTTHTTGE